MSDNYISKSEEVEAGAKLDAIDANRTLIIDQYTSDAKEVPDKEDFVDASSMNEVFEKFNPSVNVTFEGLDGDVEQTLEFHEMKDFDVNGGKGNLVTNSEFLSDIKGKADNMAKIGKQMKKSSALRKILANSESKDDLRRLLQAMLDELEK